MLEYPLIAQTAKTIDKLTFNMYLDISINMLKYNHDTSATLRVLSTLVDTSQDVIEDLSYMPRFKMSGLDFISIDRFNTFALSKIPGANVTNEVDRIHVNTLQGYCKYTGNTYDLEYVKDKSDFIRHSFPCDAFIGDQVFSDGYRMVTLSPNIKMSLDLQVQQSQISVRPYTGFSSTSMLDGKTVTLFIYGISATGKEIEEEIVISSDIDFKSTYEYSFVTGMMATGSLTTVSVIAFPYNNGEFERWDNDIVDRESTDLYPALITVDSDNKQLVFSAIKNLDLGFPGTYETYKAVDIDVEGAIWAYYVDRYNKLLYVLTDDQRLHCFPLVIPVKYNNTLDDIKTNYQAIRVEYYEDPIARNYTFYIFPSSTTNDIESLGIFINGQEYTGTEFEYQDMMLDMIRQNITTNRIIIPFEDLFVSGDDCLVEFRTYGIDQGVTPVYLCNPKLPVLYSKDMSSISPFVDPQPGFINAMGSSNTVGYKEYISGDMQLDNECTLIKLSGCANVLVNGYKIINVFKTFTLDDLQGTIITSDTITHTKGV